MSKVLKYALIFGTGASVGFVSGGLFTILKGFGNYHIRNGIVDAITERFKWVVYENEKVSI